MNRKKSLVVLVFLALYIAPMISLATYDISTIPAQHNNKDFSLAFEPWFSDWEYRQEIQITGSSGAGTNYAINLTVPYNANMETDFADLRFTDNDKTTELSYYREYYTLSTSARFWVKVTDNLDSSQSIYMYYGKTGASTTSNATAVFPFYDGFEDNNFDKWDIAEAQWSVFYGSGDPMVKYGLYSAYGDSAATNRALTKVMSIDYDAILHTWVYFQQDNAQEYVFFGKDEGATDIYPLASLDDDWNIYDGTAWREYATSTAIKETWLEVEVAIDFTNNYWRFWCDGVEGQEWELKDGSGGAITSVEQIGSITPGIEDRDTYLDDFYIRKWVLVEPVATIQATVENEPVLQWEIIETVTIWIVLPINPGALWNLNVLLVFFGAGMIIFSTSYFAVKIKNRDVDTNACFYGSILFLFGWALLLGVIIG